MATWNLFVNEKYGTAINLFADVCLVTWPLSENEAVGDLVMIETSLLLSCKFLLIIFSRLHCKIG